MRHRFFAVFVVVLVAVGCGSASDVSSGRSPTTIPLFDSTDSAADSTADTTIVTSTTETAEPVVSLPEAESSTSTSSSAPASTTTTTSAATTTTVDVNAEYCASYNRLASMDVSIAPGDTEATAAVFAAREAAWIETAALAPSAIVGDAGIVRDFTSALRQLLADNGNDLAAVLPEVVQLETDFGADESQILVEQFGLLECGTEASDPAEETAVFYASLLDTDDRRSVLADLLSTAGVLTVAEADCVVASATPEMMFPLTGASSTPTQDAAFGQLLGVCQLTAGGS